MTSLLVTDEGAGLPRTTLDVDAIAEISSYAEYTAFGERLRALGFSEDTSEDAPLCRWVHSGTILDVMPLDEKILGFSNRWYPAAMEAATSHQLLRDLEIRVVTAPYFLRRKSRRSKVAARGDFLASHDLEDLIFVIDGRSTIVEEIRAETPLLREYLPTEITDYWLRRIYRRPAWLLAARCCESGKNRDSSTKIESVGLPLIPGRKGNAVTKRRRWARNRNHIVSDRRDFGSPHHPRSPVRLTIMIKGDDEPGSKLLMSQYDPPIKLMPLAMSKTRSIDVTALVVLIGSLAMFQPIAVGQTSAGVRTATAASVPDQYHAMLTTYCFTCHNTRAKIGGLALDTLDLQAAADDARTWEKALRKLRGHLMPPPGNPQPPPKDVDSFVAWMENTLDSHPKGPKAGYVPIQRLNRTEYAASVKALVGVDVNPKDVLPQDIQVDGFDNIADALSVSPAFLDQYVAAARHVAKLAIGDPTGHVSNVKYSIAANQNQR